MDLTFNTNTDFDQTKVLITNIIKNTADDYDLFLSENSINKSLSTFNHCNYPDQIK